MDTMIVMILSILLFAGVSSAGDHTADFSSGTLYGNMDIPLPEDMGPELPWQGTYVQSEPPENPQVGDSWLWWLYMGGSTPYYEQASCTIRGLSNRCYVAVKDDQWMVTVDQDDVNRILEYWESISLGLYSDTGIYDLDSLAFGTPPDRLDDDPGIYLLYYDMGPVAAGYFFMFDEYPDGTFPGYRSNECEVIYLNPESPGGPGGNMMLAVAAHEFQHMIHWNADPNEASWVNEGMAVLAMWLFGYTDPISGFNSNPDNGLVDWDGTWPDYVQSFLWSLYFYENCGGMEAVNLLVQEPANSMAGYEAVLDSLGNIDNVDDIFGDWIVANFLDDTLLAQGQFGYRGVQLPPFSTCASYSMYPVNNASESVNHWAADYYRFTGFGEKNGIVLSFDGDDSSEYRVRGISILSDGTRQVHEMDLDAGTQTGSLWIGGLESPGDEVILAVGDVLNSGGTSEYSFSAEAETGTGTQPEMASALSLHTVSNPFSGNLELSLTWEPGAVPHNPAVTIFDLNGRLVRTFHLEGESRGYAEINWNGRNQSGIPCPSGIYLVRATHGKSCDEITATLLSH